jgi:hypothetical protein
MTSERMSETELTGLSSLLVLEKAQVRKKDSRPNHNKICKNLDKVTVY